MTARRTPRVLARALGLVSLTAPLAATLVLVSPPAASAAQSRVVAIATASGTTLASGAIASEDVVASGSITNTGSTTSGGRLVLLGPADFSNPPQGYNWSGPIGGCSPPLLSSSCTKSLSHTVSVADMKAHVNGYWSAQTCDVNGANCTPAKGWYANFGPTATPAGVTATATNPAPGATTGTVDLSWTYAGTEPDLWGFRVVESTGQTTDDVSAATAACTNGTCHFSKKYDNAPGSTKDYSFTVTALRTSGGCSACGTTVPGAASAPATAQLVTPQPPPSPTPAPSGSASPAPGGTPAPSTAPGTKTQAGGKPTKPGSQIIVPTLPPVAAARKNFALGYNNFSPSLGIPKLPPLPATTFAETVGGSEGTYQPTLPYKPQPAKSSPGGVLSAPLAAVTSLDTEQLARSLAAALILMVAAAHVRLFLSGHRPD